MNQKLLDARRKFKGQKVKIPVSGDFDNSPFVLGIHTFEVMESECRDLVRSGRSIPTHYMRLKCETGDDKGRGAFPFAPDLSDLAGVVSSVAIIRSVLGDVVPGSMNNKNEFVSDIPAFLEDFDKFSADCIGELVEVKVVNQKVKTDGSHLKNDGDPWQNFFIIRGLGEDKAGVTKQKSETASQHTADDNLNFGSSKAKKPVAKRKVVKKKVVKKKAKRKK